MKRLSTALTSMPYAQLSAHAIATGTAQREDSPHRCPHLNAIRTTLCTRDRHRNCSKGGFTPPLPSPQCHTHGSAHAVAHRNCSKGGFTTLLPSPQCHTHGSLHMRWPTGTAQREEPPHRCTRPQMRGKR